MSSRGALRAAEIAVVVILAIALVAFVAINLLDRPALITYARLLDEQTLALGTVTGSGTWTRVTQVRETPDEVVVAVSSLSAPVPGAGDDLAELTVHLAEPIGTRRVVDANTGADVPKTTCLPPAYLASGCTEP